MILPTVCSPRLPSYKHSYLNVKDHVTNDNYQHEQPAKHVPTSSVQLNVSKPSGAPSPVKLSFGHPNETLMQPPLSRQPSFSSLLLRTPTRPRTRSNVQAQTEHATRPNSTTTTPITTPSSRRGRLRSRSQFLANQTFDELPQPANHQIPSSRTPSPMKIPKQPRGRRLSNSPTKLVVDPEVAKALQDSITSLLGKRPSEEDRDGVAGSGGGRGRPGKRARPHRTKVHFNAFLNPCSKNPL